MKQLLILSGKGGTGKTTIASAFIRLSDADAYADCDVDAPNLHLVMSNEAAPKNMDYFGIPKAVIDDKKCIKCGLCKEKCRFAAIYDAEGFTVDPFACEGCGVCAAVCPADAVSMKPAVAGELTLYSDYGKVFSTARLKMGSGTSGRLVTEVKKQMRAEAVKDTELAIIDGSPGIGCPVIASISGVNMVLIVAEPSLSGINDMERIIKTAELFKVKIAVCVNKYDTNEVNTRKIEDFCRISDLPFVGKIPFDHEAVKAINNGQTIVDINCPSGAAVREIYDNIIKLII
ncbi:Electron transport complex subunit RsxB [bioreactor metagenome]|uniref:Electron transport complex subunit RsxB n=1 Tax=bioreactor metagenome TaxID=1076179 RepID=A0A644YZE1_9ZZZZ|nr:ATP-binding protein [Oscillospiraceae bacterium]